MIPPEKMHSFISERIKELRLELNLTQDEVAHKISENRGLHIDRSLISKWETSFHEPDIDNLFELASLFNSSVEYIIGKSNDRHPRQLDSSPSPAEMRRITEIMNKAYELYSSGEMSKEAFIELVKANG